jgi:hypothetical protein
VKQLLSAERLDALGPAMAKKQEDLLREEPRHEVVNQTDAAADLR